MAQENRQPRVGSTVEISIPNGLGLVNGQTVQEYKTVRARVHMLGPNGLVCTVGKRYGHPYVADTFRLIRY